MMTITTMRWWRLRLVFLLPTKLGDSAEIIFRQNTLMPHPNQIANTTSARTFYQPVSPQTTTSSSPHCHYISSTWYEPTFMSAMFTIIMSERGEKSKLTERIHTSPMKNDLWGEKILIVRQRRRKKSVYMEKRNLYMYLDGEDASWVLFLDFPRMAAVACVKCF